MINFRYEDLLRPPANPSRGAESGDRALRSAFRTRKAPVLRGLDDIEVLRGYPLLPTVFARVTSSKALLALANDRSVLSIRSNRPHRLALAQSLGLINQPSAAAAGATGHDTAVAVLDTGVDFTNAAFGSCAAAGDPGCTVVYATDFADDDGVNDDSGHGTNVAGIVAGVAPSTKILALDVFEPLPPGAQPDELVAHPDDIVEAIEFVLDTRVDYKTRAINLSLGSRHDYHTTECTGSTYAGVFQTARSVGIVPVVAAGNDAVVRGFLKDKFMNGVSEPACAPGAVRVGAVYDSDVGKMSFETFDTTCTDKKTAADKIACFSQSGPLLTVFAPGSPITAAGIAYSGTSQATPHVAGAIAALASAAPGATSTDLVNALTSSGPTIEDGRAKVSRRRLDVKGALAKVTTALDFARTIAADSSRVTGASFVATPPTPPSYAVRSLSVSQFPRAGLTYGVISTGDPSVLTNPNSSSSTGKDLDGGSVRGDTDFDVTVLKIDFTVPSGDNCLSFDFRFLSEEYPEFVGSNYNDAFLAELDNSTWTTAGSVISTPDNFAFDPANDVISINTTGYTSMSTADASGTTFDGATPLLRAQRSVSPGSHSLYLSIFDEGDRIYDSAVLVDNLRSYGAASCNAGAQLQELRLAKTADKSSAKPNSATGYTITITNPNSTDVLLDSLGDTLPSGFSYTASSTSGMTASNPAVIGTTLLWSGPWVIPANTSASIHFAVRTSAAKGSFYNSATGTSSAGVRSTGPTALIKVK